MVYGMTTSFLVVASMVYKLKMMKLIFYNNEKIIPYETIDQGSPFLLLESHYPAEFS